jgi:hypothetical protein
LLQLVDSPGAKRQGDQTVLGEQETPHQQGSGSPQQ